MPSPAAAVDDCGGVHPDEPAKGAEHCIALSLADPAQATAVVGAGGVWSDPDAWRAFQAPEEGSRVHVPRGATVTIDGEVAETIEWIRVDGTLRFAPDARTSLRVGTIIETPEGNIEIGSADAPVASDASAEIVFADLGPVDTQADPGQWGRGAVLHGGVQVHGAEKTSWGALADAPHAGDRTLTLVDAPVNWAAGDVLVVAGTGIAGDERVEVAAVSGSTVELTTPLEVDHVPPRDDLDVHVANLSRNVVFRSESQELDRRGHVMFMHTREVDVAHAAFRDLGRTDKLQPLEDIQADLETGYVCGVPGPHDNTRGRYSVHFHRNGVVPDGDPATVRGSVVEGNPGWGYVNHSSYVDFTDNVAYDVAGAAYNTEAGDETGSFTRNISIRSHGEAETLPVDRQAVQDYGFAGDGFWLQGPGVSIVDNVAAGATGAGIILYSEGLLEPDIGRTRTSGEAVPDGVGADTLPTVLTPVQEIRGNQVYGSTVGFWTYYHRTDITLGEEEAAAVAADPPDLPSSVISDLTAWSNRTGVRTNYTVDTTFRDLTIVAADDVEPMRHDPDHNVRLGVGFDGTNVYNRGETRYENLDVSGYDVGLIPARNGRVVIDGGRFENRSVDIAFDEPRQVDRDALVTGDIQFPGASGGWPTTRFRAEANLNTIVDSEEDWYHLADRITLDYGEFDGDQLYYEAQVPDRVLWPEQPPQETPDDPGEPVPEDLLGLTAAEVADRSGSPFAGALAPSDARSVDGVGGVVGTPSGVEPLARTHGDALRSALVEEDEDPAEFEPAPSAEDMLQRATTCPEEYEGEVDEDDLEDEELDDEGFEDEGFEDEGFEDEGFEDEGFEDGDAEVDDESEDDGEFEDGQFEDEELDD